MFVFLAFSIFSAILAIYLVAFQNRVEMNSKVGDKMRIHALVWFWTSFLFLVYFAIDNGVLNFGWILGLTLYLLFNVYLTRFVVDHSDFSISRKYESTLRYAIGAIWLSYLFLVFGSIAGAQLGLFLIFFLLVYLLTNIVVTIFLFDPKDKPLPIEGENNNKEN